MQEARPSLEFRLPGQELLLPLSPLQCLRQEGASASVERAFGGKFREVFQRVRGECEREVRAGPLRGQHCGSGAGQEAGDGAAAPRTHRAHHAQALRGKEGSVSESRPDVAIVQRERGPSGTKPAAEAGNNRLFAAPGPEQRPAVAQTHNFERVGAQQTQRTPLRPINPHQLLRQKLLPRFRDSRRQRGRAKNGRNALQKSRAAGPGAVDSREAASARQSVPLQRQKGSGREGASEFKLRPEERQWLKQHEGAFGAAVLSDVCSYIVYS